MEEQNEKESGIQLAEMIQSLRSELQHAQDQSQDAGILLEVEKVELELQVAVTHTAKGEGEVKLKFWVIEAGGVGGGYERSRVSTHTFNLTLKPVARDTGGRVLVSDADEVAPTRD